MKRIILMSLFIITGCDSNPAGNNNADSIVGSWYSESIGSGETLDIISYESESGCDISTFVFEADGTGTTWECEDLVTDEVLEPEPFVWALGDDGKYTVTIDDEGDDDEGRPDEDEVWIVEITETGLLFYRYFDP